MGDFMAKRYMKIKIETIEYWSNILMTYSDMIDDPIMQRA